MFHIMKFTCIIALILIKFRIVELTSGGVRLRYSDVGPEEPSEFLNRMSQRNSNGRNYSETIMSEEAKTTSPEVESSTVRMLNRWLEGINPWTNEVDCCAGVPNTDCNQTCTMTESPCSFDCGYLLLPTNATPAEVLTTLLKAKSGGRIHLTVSYKDLRQGDNITVFNREGDEPLDNIKCDSFTNEQQEKYFVSDGETLFVTYEYVLSTEERGCGGYEDPTAKLQLDTIRSVECSVPISEDAHGNLFGDIVSPYYQHQPYPSLRKCTWIIQTPSPGYGIELQVKEVDLNAAYGDYLQIKSGSASSKNHGYLMTWSNTNPQHVFRIFSGGSANIFFYSGLHLTQNEYKGFHIVYRHFGNGSLPASTTTPGPLLPTPSQGHNSNCTLYIAGKTPEEFNNDKNYFKDSLVLIANAFCQEEHIELTGPISFQDVFIHSIIHCPQTWPHSYRCAEVIIQIVARTVSGEYELTDSNIQKMWDRYGWDRNVTRSGITPYERNPEVATWWLIGTLFVLILFIIILFTTWYLKKKPHYSSSKNKEQPETEGEEKTSEANILECPFRTIEEYDDKSSYTSDHRDSYLDYEDSIGSETYSNYNDSSASGGKINPAYMEEDDEELDEISLSANDGPFQFVNYHPNSRVGRNHHTPGHERIFKMETNADGRNSETVL